MISALVINLERSVARLAFQQQQLAALGIPMRRLAAVAVDDIERGEYEALANGWERKMRPAEVACFLSHKLAWQQVAEGDEPCLILEDDALLARHTKHILQALSANVLGADYVTLEARSRKKLLGKPSALVADSQLCRLYQDRSGAAAYVLFPQGARILLAKATREAVALADAFLCRAYELKAYQVVPAAAIQLDQCVAYGIHQANPFVSTITPADQAKPKAHHLGLRWRFKYRRIVAQVRMGWRQLTVLGRARRIWVPVVPADFDHAR